MRLAARVYTDLEDTNPVESDSPYTAVLSI